MAEDKPDQISRRSVLRGAAFGGGLLAVGGVGGALVTSATRDDYVWQINPHKCIECGNCANYCVLETSAVKAVHAFSMCGRCKMCTGYYVQQPGSEANAGAEFQLCPTHAIERQPIEHTNNQFFEYQIDEDLCIGCGKCVKGCKTQNGSLYLQVKHDCCVDCNECAIAAACPGEAFVRVPASTPYFDKAAGLWVRSFSTDEGQK
ncbi:MAG: 4Fe-4S dicluster domain-containing protein [Planctomycetota bacterium]